MNKKEGSNKGSVVKKIRKYMKKKGILEVEINWKRKIVLSLEPIKNHDKTLFVDLWLKNELSTEKLEENMKLSFWYVQYFLDDFMNDVGINSSQPSKIDVGREEIAI